MSDCIACSPKVFHRPQRGRDPNLVALMIPFDESFHAISETVKAVAERLHMRCERADDIWRDSVIIQDIFELIYQSAFVVCDFSNKNPNVFYEAGIAHTLGRDIIPLVQNKNDIPFDLQHHRFIVYLPNTEGLKALDTQLCRRMQELHVQEVSTAAPRQTPIVAPPWPRYEDRCPYD